MMISRSVIHGKRSGREIRLGDLGEDLTRLRPREHQRVVLAGVRFVRLDAAVRRQMPRQPIPIMPLRARLPT